ncbi:MAG: dolichol-phosphate mannosyltransferase [Methanohalophilus sp. T328-1]|uniref:Dolichol-phosphate mannosyltransferase n=1 Tax=Methanohalophilus euhalobius TaxID=51203 RepID=A0A285F542_9EURY|nr:MULTISPECIES: S-layer glycoprotein N-glycosyltransferase AglJ [Methanohalophilus]KXS46848.1 MAG: dolichol-phosphate mannosyltransferase [Methanohalophilus sp. T328-1]RSD36097.1 MAG: dolichol-phosphate mannosyltransferase [Methanohalophilus sp.]OBZ35441.1 MAG: glycosyltransferase, TIGR04182 family [Methanohalophilus sp. DAL1]ODV50027.1 MAG: dolichol-phosphate mannosyltransferase [Methanohalophilus sp. 2-GBenrich]RXG34789.1 dolichol-phosphate mannosyltransferase [Methanohalophilus sp. WG1-DM]
MTEDYREDVCILIPTLNEGATIGQLIEDFNTEGFGNIFVIDGNSSDDTQEIANKMGARVVAQTGKGKGQAVQDALAMIDDPYVIMIDGDGTYLAKDVHSMLEPLEAGRADHVIGNRFADFDPGAFTKLNLIGNKILNKFFSVIYRKNLVDILSGYRGFTNQAIRELELHETGFEIESEIAVDSMKKEHRVEVVPITYRPRPDEGDTKLNPLKDGFGIGSTIYKMAKFHNPMFYFGIMGAILTLSGILLGIYVVSEWMIGITHIPMTTLTALLIISGIQMFIFGMLSDLVVSLHRETMRTLRRQQR